MFSIVDVILHTQDVLKIKKSLSGQKVPPLEIIEEWRSPIFASKKTFSIPLMLTLTLLTTTF